MTSELRQLNERESDGIKTELLWEPDSNRLFVRISEGKGPHQFEQFEVTSEEDPTDAFNHPFAYLGTQAAKAAAAQT